MHAASLSLRHVLVLVRFTLTGLTPGISTLLLRIQGEYREMPGLQLTEAQARRLWDFEGNTCSLVPATLLEQRFLKRTPSGTSDSCTAVRRIRPNVMLKLKRAYEPASRSDGTRILVQRLWPRGVSKETLRLDAWLKDVGASTELRQWFRHHPDKWPSFRTRYFRELDSRPEAWRPIVSAARRGTVTLVYSSRDTEHNNAVALKDYLQSKIRRQPGSR